MRGTPSDSSGAAPRRSPPPRSYRAFRSPRSRGAAASERREQADPARSTESGGDPDDSDSELGELGADPRDVAAVLYAKARRLVQASRVTQAAKAAAAARSHGDGSPRSGPSASPVGAASRSNASGGRRAATPASSVSLPPPPPSPLSASRDRRPARGEGVSASAPSRIADNFDRDEDDYDEYGAAGGRASAGAASAAAAAAAAADEAALHGYGTDSELEELGDTGGARSLPGSSFADLETGGITDGATIARLPEPYRRNKALLGTDRSAAAASAAEAAPPLGAWPSASRPLSMATQPARRSESPDPGPPGPLAPASPAGPLARLLAGVDAQMSWLDRMTDPEGFDESPAAARLAVHAADLVQSVLRGAGQVAFADNPLSGLLIVLALLYDDSWRAMVGLVALASSTVAGVFFGFDRALRRAGVHGYNGLLVGLAVGVLHQSRGRENWEAALVQAAVYGAFSTVLREALSTLLGVPWRLPAFTWAFNLTALMLTLVSFPPVPPASVSARDTEVGDFDAEQFLYGVVRGPGQVYFASSRFASLLMVLGLGVSSRIVAAMSLLGSFGGSLAAWLMGAPLADIYAGLYSYDGCLGAIAVGGVYYVATPRVALLALLNAGCCAVIRIALGTVFARMPIPTFTLGFCTSTSVFLLIRASVAGFAEMVESSTTPEGNRAASAARRKALAEVGADADAKPSPAPSPRPAGPEPPLAPRPNDAATKRSQLEMVSSAYAGADMHRRLPSSQFEDDAYDRA